jgi:5-oxopent-3-ene-1,2,5-tricarboxylate decarboxylase / 2-hydroxyhepta-2,4-diene-1,7-dioate isomerase
MVSRVESGQEAVFAKLRRCTLDSVWNGLSARGYGDQFIGGLQVIHPDRVMVGRARTLRLMPKRPDLEERVKSEGPYLVARAVMQTEPGDIMVVDAGGCVEAGFIGDILVAGFMARGGSGILCDGAVRDLSYLRTVDLPLYTRGAHASGVGRRLVGLDLNIPVRIAEVTVLPGDVLMGDAEGVLAIPAELAEAVADEALATDEKEAFLREKLAQGVSIVEAYPPSEAIMQEYRARRLSGGTG